MSGTPRTDANSGWSINYRGKSSSDELYIDPNGVFVHSAFARTLERELAAANERIKRLEEAGNALAARLRLWKTSETDWLCKLDGEAVSDWEKAKELET